MTLDMAQIFHRATAKTAVGRNLAQKCEVCPGSWELSGTRVDGDELLNSPGEVQTYERKDTPKRRSAQVVHRAGNAKKELVYILMVLLACGEEHKCQQLGSWLDSYVHGKASVRPLQNLEDAENKQGKFSR